MSTFDIEDLARRRAVGPPPDLVAGAQQRTRPRNGSGRPSPLRPRRLWRPGPADA